MSCYFLLTKANVLMLTENVSNIDYFMSSEDLEDLIKDKNLLTEFLDGLGKESLIVRPLGDDKDDVYTTNGVEILKVGEVKW